MPRFSRTLSQTGIYHIMLRGNERKVIFIDEDDRKRFIDTVIEKSVKENAAVYAYCLMDNHIHLLVGGLNGNLAKLMKRIAVSYVYYFNKKFKRIGHLFHDRFKSENIESDTYLLEAVRYIHNNPVKAGMVKSPLEYPWSSFHHYIRGYTRPPFAFEQILGLFSQSHTEAIQQFIAFSSKFNDFQLLDLPEETPEEQRARIENQAESEFHEILTSSGVCGESLKYKENSKLRNEIVRTLKSKYNLSIRQMEKITGINRGMVLKIFQKYTDDVNKNRPD